MAYHYKAPDDSDRLDVPTPIEQVDDVSFDSISQDADVYLPCNRQYDKGDIVFVGKVGFWDGFKTFVSPEPHIFGANVFDNASSGFALWYGQIEFPMMELVRMSFGAFEVKQYFPLTRRIHLRHQFDGFESIAKSMGRAGYAAHSWHALQQWEYHSAMNHCLSNMSEEWSKVIRTLDDPEGILPSTYRKAA